MRTLIAFVCLAQLALAQVAIDVYPGKLVPTTSGPSGTVTEVTGGTGITVADGTDTPTVSADTAVVRFWSSGAGDPSANCTAGQESYVNSTNREVWECVATNTWARKSGNIYSAVDTGGDDTYAPTTCAGFPTVYAGGQVVVLQATTANTGAATLDCGPGAKAIKLVDGTTDPPTNAITSKRPAILQYDATADSGSGAWLLKTIAATDIDAADKAGTDSKVVTAAAKGTAGNCAEWTATGLGDAGFACSSGGGGGGTVADPYVVTVSAQTTLTVTAATHGQGISPIAQCFDNSTPRIAVNCSYSKETDGQIVFTWSPAFTGQVVIMSAGGGDELTTIRAVTGTTDTVLDADCGGMVTYSNASSISVTLPQAGASSEFVTGCTIRLLNKGAGTVTVTPGTSTIGGAASITLGTGEWLDVVSDGTNYEIAATNRATAGTGVTLTKARTGVTIGADTSVVQTRNAAITAGTAPAYTLDLTPNLGSYSNLTRITVQFHAASTGAATIDVDGLGAKKLYLANGTTQITNELAEDRIAEFVYNDTLDSAAGAFQMVGDGGGTGGSSTTYINLPAATCQYGAAGTGFTMGTSLYPTPTCVTGSNRTYAVLDFPNADGEYAVQWSTVLRGTVTSIDLNGKWRTSATSGSVVWQVQTSCVADAETSDPAWNSAQTITDAAKGTTLQENDFSLTTVTLTGCATGERLNVRFFRQRTHASDDLAAAPQLIDLGFVINR